MTPSWPHDDILHAWWVQPGQVLAGEYPASLDPEKSVQKLRVLLEAGVDSVIDLTEAGERSWGGIALEPYHEALCAAADELGVSRPAYIRLGIPDTSIIDDDGYDRIVEYIRGELDSGRVVYVHCWGGKGRTGTVVGAWLITDEALAYPAVLDRIKELRAGTRKANDPAPENRHQRDVLRRLAARQEGGR
ncbi:protein-tyrosine phosphatase family protein [[Mycobacterium] nativiensis]|uniref:Serine/threonine protein phosphatase n=1 Tax=[Mycobacterium] nativiensis TaxID=2855503 RepID=A0ABU5XVR7_9MYCO|nr:serine/threonine protein phosphatase [Mycolicibacter sp. MYC340]MEB3032079.1 serine/threonine protein phosphatase [Mycolicibacter sp. MYC340]